MLSTQHKHELAHHHFLQVGKLPMQDDAAGTGLGQRDQDLVIDMVHLGHDRQVATVGACTLQDRDR